MSFRLVLGTLEAPAQVFFSRLPRIDFSNCYSSDLQGARRKHMAVILAKVLKTGFTGVCRHF